MRRRDFLATAAAGSATAVGIFGGGCNASQWLTTALNDLPTILQIVTSVISIIGATSGGVTTAALAAANIAGAKAKDAIAEALAFLAEYQKNKTSTLLGNVDDALATAQDQLKNILPILGLKDPKYAAILSAAIGSALTIIVAVQSLVPAPQPSTPTQTSGASRRIALAKVTPSSQVPAIRLGFNEALEASGGSQFTI